MIKKDLEPAIAKPPPEPLKRTLSETFQPQGRHKHLQDPDSKYDQQVVFTLHASKKTKTAAIKNKGADQGLEDIVRKGGPANCRETIDEPLHTSRI